MLSRAKTRIVFATLALTMACVISATARAASERDPASAVELVRATVANEVAASNDPDKHMFRSRKQTPQGSQTRLYVETREAMAGMTIAYNDKPLPPEQLQAEENRLAGLVGSSEQLARKHFHEKENAEHTLLIVKALPDAFLYQYDGDENASPEMGGKGRLVRLKFRPNPNYQPPSHVEQVLLGMSGVIVIDPAARRIAKIDGTLFKEVSFGWGILGHLNKDGHFLVEQKDVGNNCWDVSRMSLDFTGKILMFKSLAIKTDEIFSDFRRVPNDITFAQGVEMLKAEEVSLAQNQRLSASKPDIGRSSAQR